MSSAGENGSGELSGLVVGLSVSESEDLARLGFAETHMRMVLGEFARSLLLAGASILYGGRIDPAGYTDFLRREIERYGDREGGLIVFLPWAVHRRMSLAEIAAAREDLGVYGEIVCLGGEGERVEDDAGRDEEPQPVPDEEAADSLSAARAAMVECASVRILAGGRRQGFSGRMPGVLEEALLSIQAGRPLFLAGGFGGITADIAIELGLDPAGVLPSLRDPPAELAEIAECRAGTAWSPEGNALDLEENRRLAVSHRPGEVTSLVLAGLGRLRN